MKTTEIDRKIAEHLSAAKLGDPTWERQWQDLLDERHGRSRVPTVAELATALAYIEREFRLDDGVIDGEQWAEGLAFGRFSGDTHQVAAAKEMLGQLSRSQWTGIAARADYLASTHGMAPRFGRL